MTNRTGPVIAVDWETRDRVNQLARVLSAEQNRRVTACGAIAQLLDAREAAQEEKNDNAHA